MEAKRNATYSLILTAEEFELVKLALHLSDVPFSEMDRGRAQTMLGMLRYVEEHGHISGATV